MLRGPWHAEDIERLEFVSDYEIEGGLIEPVSHVWPGRAADRGAGQSQGRVARRALLSAGAVLPGHSFLARSRRKRREQATADVYRCTLELYDPLFSSDIAVCNRLVPLETDLTTPLAYFLDNPAFKEKDLATIGLFESQQSPGNQRVSTWSSRSTPIAFRW